MHETQKIRIVASAFFCVIVPMYFGLATHARAADYPDRPIHLSVGFGPGSGPDLLARVLGEGLQRELNVPVVIENKGGAGGAIAMQHLTRQRFAHDAGCAHISGAGH